MKAVLCFATVLLAGVPSSAAFVPSPSFSRISSTAITNQLTFSVLQAKSDLEERKTSKNANGLAATFKSALSTAAIWAATNSIASAAGPDWGIFEGRTGSLLHPIMMASLLLFSLQTGFLGLQWRRQRTMGDEISALKKSLPDLGGASSVSAAIEAAKATDPVDSALVSKLEAGLETEKTIKDLTSERKELAAAGPRDKHYSQGALLAFLGTAFAIEGPLNTYARAGKLFPGPHLYAGAGLVVCWALAAACVPSMQKGNDTARTVHIGTNVLGIALFVWQVTSGIPILLKVIEKTSWP